MKDNYLGIKLILILFLGFVLGSFYTRNYYEKELEKYKPFEKQMLFLEAD